MSPSSTWRSWRRRCTSWPRSSDLGRARGLVRGAQLLARHGGPRARRAAPEGARARRRDRDAAALLRSRVEPCCRTSAPTSCSRPRSSRSAAHHLRTLRRYRPYQLSEPEERVLTETNVTGGSAFQRLFTEQTSALAGAASRPRRAGLARGGPLAAAGPGPRAARRGRRGRDRVAAARPATRAPSSSTLCSRTRPPRTGCAATRTGSRRATSRTRRATSRSQALIEAVQGRYDLARRWYSLKARLLGLDRLGLVRPHGAGVRQRRPHPLRGRRGDRARLLPHLLAGARRGGHGVLHGRLHRRSRRALASAAAPSARTPCPRRTRT